MRPFETPRRFALRVISSYCWLKQAGLLPAYSCRFWPTCSAYAQEVIHARGVILGGWMALSRILRCRPGNPGGVDLPILHNYKRVNNL